MSFKKLNRLSINILIFLVTFFITSCRDEEVIVVEKERLLPKSFDQVLAENTDSEQKQKIVAGMIELQKKDYKGASKIFNQALSDDPTNSALHTLNALVYQMMGKNGDYASYDLAEAGYMQAKKYNPNNSFASLQLGRVKIEKRDYIGAQEQFAEVLLFDPSNKDALYELTSASYLAGDVKTARMSVDQLLQKDPNNPHYARAGALIYAVQGDKKEAQKLLTTYKNLESSPQKKVFLEKRVNDWAQLHNSGNIILAAAGDTSQGQTLTAAPQAPIVKGGPDSGPTNSSDPSVPVVAAAVAAAEAVAEKTVNPQPAATPEAIPQPQAAKSKDPMVVIDGVVLRVVESAQTQKGNNILTNFTLTVAPYSAYSANNAGTEIMNASMFPLNNLSTQPSSTSTLLPGNVNSVLPDLSKHVSLVTSAITFGTLNYALNIANSTRSHIEIIGRPTLTSYIGKPSEFFNGSELDIALQGNFGGGTVTKTPTGSTLRVTPLSVDGEYITLDVEIIDSFLEETEASISAKASALAPLVFSLDLSNVKTTVKVKMGETIMLGGTVERSEVASNSGFPILKDIPVVQYFFSDENTISEHASVLYLITPRYRKDVRRAVRDYTSQMDEFGDRPTLEELEGRHRDWMSPEKNVLPILKSLKPLYYDYRSGDISPLDWGTRPGFEDMLTEISSFLWY